MAIDHQYASALGQNIRAAREAKGIGQRELARLADVNSGYLSEVENGISEPGTKIIQKIAAALNIKVDKLLPPHP